eukprot:15212939-Alexandrium_andersonii.AAC.1
MRGPWRELQPVTEALVLRVGRWAPRSFARSLRSGRRWYQSWWGEAPQFRTRAAPPGLAARAAMLGGHVHRRLVGSSAEAP